MDEQRASAYSVLGCVSSFEGDIQAAVRHFEVGRARPWRPTSPSTPRSPRPTCRSSRRWGSRHMRRGELDNCLMNPNADRCLFPVRPGGLHHSPRGSGGCARGLSSRYLAEGAAGPPDALAAEPRGHGAGPAPLGSTRRALLLPAATFRSEAALPRFVDHGARGRTRQAGPRRGNDRGRFRRRRLARRRLLERRLLRAAAPLPEPRRRHLRGAHGSGGAPGPARRHSTSSRPTTTTTAALDIFVMRGGWEVPMRNSLLRNNGDGDLHRRHAEGRPLERRRTPPIPWPGPTTTSTAGSTSSSATSSRPASSSGTAATAPSRTSPRGRGGRHRLHQGSGGRRLRQRRLPRPLRVQHVRGRTSSIATTATGPSRDVAERLGVDKPFRASPPGSSTTTTTAGSTSSWSSYPASVEEFVKHYLGQPPAAETLTLYRNRGDGTFPDVTQEPASSGWCPPWAPTSATSTTTASWMCTSAPAPRRFGSGDAQHHAEERRRAAASSTSPPRRAPATCRRATVSPSPTSTTTVTRTWS